MTNAISRRTVVTASAGLLLAGCDKVVQIPAARRILFAGEDIHRGLQRALQNRGALAPEFTRAEMSPVFRSNGTANPGTPAYQALVDGRFADYRLAVGGLVDRPLSLGLAQLGSMPARRQITRHDCVEGWSAIGEWQGPLLGSILKAAGVRRDARYVVFHCADLFHGQPYYESIDLIDAFHPQTILGAGDERQAADNRPRRAGAAARRAAARLQAGQIRDGHRRGRQPGGYRPGQGRLLEDTHRL